MTRETARPQPVFVTALDQATAGYRLPLAELVPAAGRAGFRVLEVPAFAVASYLDRHGPGALAELVATHRTEIGQLSCGSGIPADLTVPAGQWAPSLTAWRRSVHLAAAVGCPALSVFVPRATTADRELVTVRLGELAAVAAEEGLLVNAEIHAPALLPEAARIWEEAATPNAALLVDVAALALAGLDPVAYMCGLPCRAVGWVHLADLAAPCVPGERPGRVLPGQGRLPLAKVLAALESGGYTGPVAVEVPRSEPYAISTLAHLTRAAAALTGGDLTRFFPEGGAG